MARDLGRPGNVLAVLEGDEAALAREAVHGNVVGHARLRLEIHPAELAVKGVVVVAGDLGEVVQAVAGVHGQERVDGAAQGVEDRQAAGGRFPALPDRTAAGVARVVGLTALFGGGTVVFLDAGRRAEQGLRQAEIVVAR